MDKLNMRKYNVTSNFVIYDLGFAKGYFWRIWAASFIGNYTKRVINYAKIYYLLFKTRIRFFPLYVAYKISEIKIGNKGIG